MPRKMPTKPGFYWARKFETPGGWDTIVKIEGEVPFLKYRAWTYGREVEIDSGSLPDAYTFGPKIREAKKDNVES